MFIINANIRNKIGKSFNRNLRINNKIPATIYGKNIKNLNIKLDHNNFKNIKFKNNFYKIPIIIIINKKKIKVKIKNIQFHPFKIKIIHIDFLNI